MVEDLLGDVRDPWVCGATAHTETTHPRKEAGEAAEPGLAPAQRGRSTRGRAARNRQPSPDIHCPREIGVMRSVGATSYTIVSQSLVEGLVVGLVAWVLGVPFSYALDRSLIAQFIFQHTAQAQHPPVSLLLGLVSTLVIAALFFAKWSIDQGFFSPVIRLASMLLIGAGALVWAEVKLREEYQTTANAVSGAGIVILYVAFFAGHSLYQLVSLPVEFAGMSGVTLLAGLIAIRFAAHFTALIGIAGGLATPVLLSSGVDRPLGLWA